MKFKLNLDGRELIVEFNNLAERANGEALVRYGETVVLTTTVMSSQDRENLGFFPLTVDYEEKYYAAGKIFGPRYIKREGRPSEGAVLSARLIDRAIRPRFPEGLKREVQAIVTCLSWDGQNDPDILGLIGASIALSVSDIPWQGPLAALRVGRLGDKLVLNPTYEEREAADLDLVLAGTAKQGEILINMLEAGGEEVADDIILEAVKKAEPFLKKIIAFQNNIIKKIGRDKLLIEPTPQDPDLEKDIKEFLGDKLEKCLFAVKKGSAGQPHKDELNTLKQELLYFIEGKYPGMGKTGPARDFFEKQIEQLLSENILNKEQRPDLRKLDEVRSINCQAGLLPRTHGSALFCRGQTKALSILTLGAPGDQQMMEGMEIVGKKRFMHHYNFPPYSVGETKPLRGPSRRDIGHGMLAEKALFPLIPDFQDFPYTVRLVSEMLSSNGSTSMASVSSSSLALMDAGVPIKRPAAGIALGLIRGGKGDYKILTDIQGPEDHHGHMDFKVAGTKKGVTALQMDVKIDGINKEILQKALKQGRKVRDKILDEMEKVLASPRAKLSPHAPRILILQIRPEKIGEVIGPGGKVIREICEECEVQIDIEDDGSVFITSEKDEAAKKAMAWIKNITREFRAGEVFQGKVKRILDFGAMVEIAPGHEGLVHISKLAPYRVESVRDVLKEGQVVRVKIISIDEQGRINLSLQRARRLRD